MKKILQLLRDNAAKERQPLVLVRNEAAAEATLYVYDIIDSYWGVSAMEVSKAIAGLDPSVTLRMRINSPGGDVFEARAIVTAIRDFGGKTIAQVDGLAASAASWIATACNEVEIADGGFFMIHNAFGGCFGNKDDMRAMGNLLEKIEGSIVAEYAKETGQPVEQIQQWLNAETWFDANEAVANGFADRVVSSLADKPANVRSGKWNLAAFDKTPEQLLNPVQTPAPEDFTAQIAHNTRRLSLFEFA